MIKKAFVGIGLLLLGFFLGGAFFYLSRIKPVESPRQVVIPEDAKPALQENKRAFSDTVKAVFPSVVNISTVKTQNPNQNGQLFDFYDGFFGPFFESKKGKEQGLGSGVIVSPEGYVITNYHVVSNAEKIKVTLYDKKVLPGRVIGVDRKTDLAIVKISSGGLPVLNWRDSGELKVGEFVLAIGNPFGLSHTVTMGIVSAVGRAGVGIADYEDFIQTDAAINPGNSGGPLVDSDGNLVGINTAIFSRSGGYQGIGFAVPSNMARLIMEQLIKKGKVVRGWLGVNIQDLTPELSREFGYDRPNGVIVVDAVRGGPAERSGVRNGDIILEFGGKAVEGTAALKNMVAESKPGARVPVRILRQGKRLGLIMTVEEMKAEHEASATAAASGMQRNALTGLSTMTLTEDMSRQLGLEGRSAGVVVVGVEGGSPAEEAGLRRGDVIIELNHVQLKDMEDFRRAAADIRAEETVLLFINRGGRKFYLTVQS